MKNEEKTQIKTSGSPDIVHSVDESRRSFSKKGLIAPVIMTLANRSAWGGTNMCTQSGFASYQDQGKFVSHAAHEGNNGWKSPSGWAGVDPWPSNSGLVRANYRNNSNNFSSSSWSGRKTLAEVLEYETINKVIILRDTFNGISANVTNVTLWEVLNNNVTNKLDYEIATVLNNAVSPVPSYFLGDNVPLADFEEFYINCVG
jgi:hypothetical protein